MIQPSFSSAPWLSRYVELLLPLHRLIASGEGDSEAADELRDQMDEPWMHLGSAEITLTKGLSADLHTLGRECIEPEGVVDTSETAAFNHAVDSQNWPQALAILRRNQEKFPQGEASIFRGQFWACMDLPAAAIPFFEDVARLRPLETSEEQLFLVCAVLAGQARDFVSRAREILDRTPDARRLLMASEVLFKAAAESESEEFLREAISAAERGLNAIPNDGDSPVGNHDLLSAHVNLALGYDLLGESSRARQVCDDAIKLAPDDPNLRDLQSFLRNPDFPPAQKSSYRNRLQLQTRPPVALYQ
ncbi:MAG: tetratricopeptide (TPR) repeat protein [Planctomycetaceae bacterium]|jgi:tetratricopeptide (TPR) repeat protein